MTLLASAGGAIFGLPHPLFFGLLLALILVVMALEKVDKSIVALLGALVCLFFAYLGGAIEPHPGGGHLPEWARMIDWSTITVIIGTSIFVDIASRSGIFSWSAIKLTKASRGDPFRLLVCYAVLTVLFSAFLNNVAAMIIVGSLTVVSTRRLGIPALPYLFTEGLLTNVGGLLTLISSIPNIIVGNTAGIGFIDFLRVSGPFTLLAAAATVLVARWCFPELRSLSDADERAAAAAAVAEFDEHESVKDPAFFRSAWAGMGAVILGFALQGQIPVVKHLGLEFIAMGAAGLFLLLYVPHHVEETLDTVEWSLILFFVGLFAIVGVMEHAGVLAVIGRGVERLVHLGQGGGSAAVIWASALLSAVTDNIPLAAMLAKIFANLEGVGYVVQEGARAPNPGSPFWWAVVYGANLGGNITPIGSASTVVAMTIMKKEGLEFGFLQFVLKAAPFAAVQLALATLYVVLFLA